MFIQDILKDRDISVSMLSEICGIPYPAMHDIRSCRPEKPVYPIDIILAAK